MKKDFNFRSFVHFNNDKTHPSLKKGVGFRSNKFPLQERELKRGEDGFVCEAHRKRLFTSHFSLHCINPSPLGERVELLCEQSELSNSGEGCKGFTSPDATRHHLPIEGRSISCASTINDFSLFTSHFSLKSAAFTLAEVLITLGVIGVVAALTMPTLMTNINERINSHRQANIAYKITQATDKMKALGLLNGSYASTDAFVDELQKHLKIAKRCSANNIADCWPTDKVMTSDGEEFEVSKAKTGKNLNIKGNTSNNVGLVLADGSSIILTYNQDSQGMDVGDVITAQPKTLPVGFGKSQDFAYTTNTTGSIDFVMDVNGKKGPNSETIDNKYHDIRSFKAARFSKGCAGIEIPGVGCVVNLGASYDCVTGDDKAKWDPRGYYDPSCWGGAKKACDDIGMSLPDKGTLKSIYAQKSNYPDLPQSGWFWSSSEYSTITASEILFGDGFTTNNYKSDHASALCVGN